MEENGAVALPASTVMVESEGNTHIIEEGPRICPLCSSEVKLFFINFHEKFLMCENTECEFPFGHEELQFVQYKNADDESEIMSLTGHMSSLGSEISNSCWSDIEKLNRLCEAEDNRSETSTVIDITKKKRRNKRKLSKAKKEKEIQKNVQDLKGLTMELNDMSKTTRTKIRNEKWITNLRHLQDQSGLKLVEPGESMQVIKKEEEHSELKIDIEPGSSGSLSNIKIEIANKK